jgi:hypothetical protein
MCVVACAIALSWATAHDVEVLVIRDGHSKYGTRVLEHRLGRAPLEFALAADDNHLDPLVGKPCWTVNLSATLVRRVHIEYPADGGAHFRESKSVTIGPGQRASDCTAEWYGTAFAPAATGEELSAGRWTVGTWITWDE